MGRPLTSRALLLLCGALAVLLAALAAVQYRWSTRVAAADVQREKEHLDTSAALFGSEFNRAAADTYFFLQNDAAAAVRAGRPLPPVPKLVAELYYLKFPSKGASDARQVSAAGVLEPVTPPDWARIPTCESTVLRQPPALVVPAMDPAAFEKPPAPVRGRVVRFRVRSDDTCFVARLDLAYLRRTLFPQLIRRSFGPTAAAEYDFAVSWREDSRDRLYGVPLRADASHPFFAFPLVPPPPLARPDPGARRNVGFFRRVEVVTQGAAAGADLFGAGVWRLEIAHRGLPLAAAFERTRRRDMLLSIAVEALLLAAVLFLVAGARRMQRLADQKMRFVAGVSHELRTPVSALSMLSRNQADGLVAGADRVRQYGELMHQQTRRLNEMVEQTLQYAGIHSGLRRPARHEIDVRQLVEQAVAARRDELARAGFEVQVDIAPDLPPVAGDAGLLRIAFDGLLGNAQKHAQVGRWIRVAAVYSSSDKEVCISVEDRGAGIDPADQAEIFQPFCRGRAAVEAQIPGSGLGLALVRSAAEAHRGTVTLDSRPGRGSTFTLHLPV